MKKLSVLILSVGFLLSGCGKSAANVEMEYSQAMKETIQKSTYFDAENLTYKSDYHQVLWHVNRYVDTNQSCDDVTVKYEVYTNDKGDEFYFDEAGNLMKYLSAELANPSTNDDGSVEKKILSEEEMAEKQENVVRDLFPKCQNFQIEEMGTDFDYHVEGKVENSPFSATIYMDAQGEVEWMTFSYGSVPDEWIDHDYFDAQFEKYIADKKEQNPNITDYTYDTSFQLANGRIYGIYCISYEDNIGDCFAEDIGFSHEKKN